MQLFARLASKPKLSNNHSLQFKFSLQALNVIMMFRFIFMLSVSVRFKQRSNFKKVNLKHLQDMIVSCIGNAV